MLKVDARRSTVVNIVTMIVWLAVIVSIDVAIPGAPILLSVVVATASILWVSSKAHRLLTLSAPGTDDDLLSDDECWPDRVGEVYEPTEEELQEIEITVGIPGEAAGIDWTCGSCGEANSKEFALCWRCGQAFEPGSTS